MAVRSQTKVLAELDRAAGRRVAGIATRYRKDTIGPLVAAIKGARGEKELLTKLGPTLLRALDATALEEALQDDTVQAHVIGRVSAAPKETPKVKGRRDERDTGTKG